MIARGHRLETASWVPGAAAVLVLAGLFVFFPYTIGYGAARTPILGSLWTQWNHLDRGEWQHGMLVPFLSLFLAWRQREAVARLPREPSAWGWAALGLGLLFYWLGYCADIVYLAYVAFMATAAGLILLTAGARVMRALLFPWAFLAFMFPLPALDNLIAFPLRMVMSQGAHLLLSCLGIDNLRIGTAIVSAPSFGQPQGARFAIDVADPCSGIRSLFALLMVSSLYAYFVLERTWQKWALFAAAFPLAIFGNMFRIVLLTLATLALGSSFAIGTEEQPTWFHMAAGYAVFAVALGGMVAGAGLLRRLDQSPLPVAVAGSSPPPSLPARPQLPLVILALAGMTVALCLASSPSEKSTVAGVVMELPYRLGGWWGLDQSPSEAEKLILPSDTQIVRKSYESASGDNVVCSIVLSGAEKRSIHRPEICLPSQGWNVRNATVVDVPLHSGHVLQVMNLTLTRPIRTADGREIQLPAYYMYWFVGDGETTPYHWKRIWLTSWDRMRYHINHRWAYVIVTSPILDGLRPGGKTPGETRAMLEAFIADIVPSFEKAEMPPAAP